MTFLDNHLKHHKELHKKLVNVQREKIKSFKAKLDAKRSLSERLADFLTSAFGTISFLALNIVWFVIWLVVNTGLLPGVPVFDPFPFGLLTTIVSLEAICLAIIVLISQNRAAHVDDLREEIDLQINLRTEEEVTKTLIILDQIHDHLGLPPEDDAELIMMKKKTDLTAIEEELTEEMRVNK